MSNINVREVIERYVAAIRERISRRVPWFNFNASGPYTNFHEENVDWVVKTVSDHENRITVAEATLDAHTEILENHEERIEARDAEIDALEEHMDAVDTSISNMRVELADMTSDLAEMNSVVQENTSDISNLEDATSNLRHDLTTVSNDLDTLEGVVANLDEVEANPSGTATTPLSSIRIDETEYYIPSGGSNIQITGDSNGVITDSTNITIDGNTYKVRTAPITTSPRGTTFSLTNGALEMYVSNRQSQTLVLRNGGTVGDVNFALDFAFITEVSQSNPANVSYSVRNNASVVSAFDLLDSTMTPDVTTTAIPRTRHTQTMFEVFTDLSASLAYPTRRLTWFVAKGIHTATYTATLVWNNTNHNYDVTITTAFT